jgi:hypothetical protein
MRLRPRARQAARGPDAVAEPVRDLLARPVVLAALVVLVVGQMSMTSS